MKLKQALLSSFLLIGLLFLSGCYRMPEEGEYSVIPATNNPSVVGGRTTPDWMPPGVGF